MVLSLKGYLSYIWINIWHQQPAPKDSIGLHIQSSDTHEYIIIGYTQVKKLYIKIFNKLKRINPKGTKRALICVIEWYTKKNRWDKIPQVPFGRICLPFTFISRIITQKSYEWWCWIIESVSFTWVLPRLIHLIFDIFIHHTSLSSTFFFSRFHIHTQYSFIPLGISLSIPHNYQKKTPQSTYDGLNNINNNAKEAEKKTKWDHTSSTVDIWNCSEHVHWIFKHNSIIEFFNQYFVILRPDIITVRWFPYWFYAIDKGWRNQFHIMWISGNEFPMSHIAPNKKTLHYRTGNRESMKNKSFHPPVPYDLISIEYQLYVTKNTFTFCTPRFCSLNLKVKSTGLLLF